MAPIPVHAVAAPLLLVTTLKLTVFAVCEVRYITCAPERSVPLSLYAPDEVFMGELLENANPLRSCGSTVRGWVTLTPDPSAPANTGATFTV